jgi:hypothetical protein
MGVKTLRKLQFGTESTKGTLVAATTVWGGTGTIEDTIGVKLADEDVGLLMGRTRTYVASKGAKLTTEAEASFEQLPAIFDSGIKTVAGVKDGAGTGYAYTYALPTTAANTIKARTWEGGDDSGAEVMEYCFVTDFKLTGKANEALKISADWVGRQVAVQAFTGSIAIPTLDVIPFNTGILYIDAVTTHPATTAKSNTLLSVEFGGKTGFVPYPAASGSLYFGAEKQVQPEFELKVIFEHDATSVAEKVAWRAQTARSIRLKWIGTALGTGATYTYKTLILDLLGVWTKFDKIGEQNGDDIVAGTLACRYNATAASSGQFIVVNELSALAG